MLLRYFRFDFSFFYSLEANLARLFRPSGESNQNMQVYQIVEVDFCYLASQRLHSDISDMGFTSLLFFVLLFLTIICGRVCVFV